MRYRQSAMVESQSFARNRRVQLVRSQRQSAARWQRRSDTALPVSRATAFGHSPAAVTSSFVADEAAVSPDPGADAKAGRASGGAARVAAQRVSGKEAERSQPMRGTFLAGVEAGRPVFKVDCTGN